MHTNILRRLRDAVSTKRPKKWKANSSFLLHDHAPAHRSVLVKDFLAKNNLYYPNLVPADFYLFRRLKSALNGRRFVMLLTLLRMRRKS